MGRKIVNAFILFLLIVFSSCVDCTEIKFSEIVHPSVTIITKYKGASPQEVEKVITELVEKQVKGLNEVEKISSKSVQDSSIVKVHFNNYTDILVAKQLVLKKMQEVSTQLPVEAELPIISVQFSKDKEQ